tara:strand:- start:2700 stop:3344 length:645 start_codon:yes stop_codon:yes gene_type:complete
MNKSESIANLALALNLAQQQMGGAVKDSTNPFFKSSYADLASVIKAVKDPLCANGLSYVQFPITSAGGNGIGVETVLMHKSGEWVSNEFTMPMVKSDPQAAGACLSYARRYGLSSVLGLPVADSDAEAAMMRGKSLELVEPSEWDLCLQAVKRNQESIDAVKDLLADPSEENVQFAKEAFGEIEEDDQRAMWKAPTKVSSAPFTTEERRLLKGA